MIETPAGGDLADMPPTDPLSQALSLIRLSSAVFLRGEFGASWAFSSCSAAELSRLLGLGADRAILLHVITAGACRLTMASGESTVAHAGDVVMLPYSDDHTMGDPEGGAPVPVVSLLPPPPWHTMPVLRHGSGPVLTRIMCGYLHCRDLPFHPLLKALPPLIHVRPSGAAASWLSATLSYTMDQASQQQPGAATLLARLPELLFIDTLRQYAQREPDLPRSWLAAQRDPIVGRAMVLLHADPARPWTVSRLAAEAGVSRSVLADRFKRVLGQSPMRYLAYWRLQVAAHLLATTNTALARLAASTGYESEAAFSRAFKRRLGVPPGVWRERNARAPSGPA
ncbi:MAG TPA: AraC family transcriptional regulator [Hyphomicrobiaceae bacterium]|nr:AraC family transcriptional regulator [Hyphomicrobiaceae bacterium]